MREVKRYKVAEIWGIECATFVNDVTGEKQYSIEVIQTDLPWEEKVDGYYGIKDNAEANKLFKELVEKYRNL